MSRPCRLTDQVNSIGNSALYTVARNSKEILNYPGKGKVTIIKRKCYVSGRCPDTVNVNIGPVLLFVNKCHYFVEAYKQILL